jgi:hypothetical protein
VPETYRTIEISPAFLEGLISRRFSERDRGRLLRALDLLDENEKHHSLRVHQVGDERSGHWSVSASDELRMTFRRLPGGRKLMLTCSHHYAR